MIKGSNGGQSNQMNQTGNLSGGQVGYGNSSGSGSSWVDTYNPIGLIASYMGVPNSFLSQYGLGPMNKMPDNSSMQPNSMASMPSTPAYVNYQNMPNYAPQANYGPSDALMRFMSSGYASGGSVDENKINGDIEAALKLARLIGELTKKL